MKKKSLYRIIFICIIINTILLTTIIIPSYKASYSRNNKENNPIEERIIVELKDNLNTPFLQKTKVSDYIDNINGEIIDDYTINTSKLGQQEVNFEYINEDNIKIPYSFTINIIDDVSPSIWLGDTYTITTEYEGSLLEDIVCADNIDNNPKCEIIGEYNTKKEGNYNLTFKATDSSGNITEKKITLAVKKPSTNSSNSSGQSSKTLFSDIIEKYKNENTMIGIDVSSWQGDIDYEALKKAGVEFVFIRVGSTKGIEGEYFVDKNFIKNIEGFNKVQIPVGIYFYSYAKNKHTAINDAKWVLEQIKEYEISLPIVYDWESWSFYNEFNQSFYNTSMNAKAFLDTIKNAGYQGALYSSKNYLEKVWFDIGYDVWLAHYTEQTSYQGNYKYWQLCSNGKVDGINGNVDINIMYKNK